MPEARTADDKVRELQRTLYRAAKADPGRRFHVLYDKVHRRDVLERAWEQVRRNRGAAGIDRVTLADVERYGVSRLLDELAAEVAGQTYRPLPARRVWIPKPGESAKRPLSIPAIRDRIVQAAVKIVIEPVFEADFRPCSFGFRPKRSAHDALQVLLDESFRGRRWVVETDIANCFSAIPHDRLMSLVEERVCDRKVLKLLRAMLASGVMEDGTVRHAVTGTPQGGVVSPLLCNVYLNRLDRRWEAEGSGVLARYADDLVRHEAPFNRVEMKGLHLRPVAAGHRSWGQPEPGDAGEGGKQPRQRRDGSALPDDSGPASKTERCNASEPVAKPLNQRAGSNLVDMGRSAVHDHREAVDSDAGPSPRPGGHAECLRRRRGEAAGAQLGTYSVDRLVVNVGTIPTPPYPPPIQGGGGQARRRLLAPGWDGALVVVRGRESRPHGEGGQRVRNAGTGKPGGRW